MAKGTVKIDFSNIELCSTKVGTIAENIQTSIDNIISNYNSLNQEVKIELGEEFNTSGLKQIKTRLDNIKIFLSDVVKIYSAGELDITALLDVDQLELVYPNFANLSDDRKAIVLSCLRYLGLKANQMGYASNFSSQYSSTQFVGDATEHAWCAMFVGSIINYFYGNKSIIDPSYASVWKIIGNYQNQTGIAFETDERIHYYVSQALVDKYKATLNADGSCGLNGWESSLANYNSKHGTNLKVTDWINDGYIPEPGDILAFKAGNVRYSATDNTLESYNAATDKNKEAFIADSSSHDYPNDTQSYTHIGFVLGTREVDGVIYVDTIEGNVNNDVQVRSFRIDDPYLVGYGHIEYEKFDSDKQAIKEMLETGVDTTASKATVGTMTKHLLALKTDDTRGNYLVNLANNIDNLANAQTVSLVDKTPTGTITTTDIVTTSTSATQQTTTTTTATSTTTHPTYSTTHTTTQTQTPTQTQIQTQTQTQVQTPIQTITTQTQIQTPTQTQIQTQTQTQEQAPIQTITTPIESSTPAQIEPGIEDLPIDTSPIAPSVDSLDDDDFTIIHDQDIDQIEDYNDENIITIDAPTEQTQTQNNNNKDVARFVIGALGAAAVAGGGYYAYKKTKEKDQPLEEDVVNDEYDELNNFEEGDNDDYS